MTPLKIKATGKKYNSIENNIKCKILCIKIWFRLGAKIGDFDRVCTFKNLI
jgi:hypothetical protein